MADVFISYKREDEPRIEPLVQALRRAGLSVWWDRDIPAGNRWGDEIELELDKALVAIVVWSHASVGEAGYFVRAEARRALGAGKILPLVIDNVVPPLPFNEIQTISLIGWSGRLEEPELVHVLRRVNAMMTSPSVAATGSSLDVREASDYRLSLQQEYRSSPWHDRAIPLRALAPDGTAIDIQSRLLAWANGEGSRCMVLLGEFGSGKTWLLRWLASELAETNASVLPVLISCTDLLDRPLRNLGDLRRLALPEPGPAHWARGGKDLKLLILLDALDEVMDPADAKLSKHLHVIENLNRVVPAEARIALTCRTLFYQAVSEDIGPLLTNVRRRGLVDRTEEAIGVALGASVRAPYVLALSDLNDEQGDNYLRRSAVAEIWSRVSDNKLAREFARSPFTLRLLEIVLPEIAQSQDEVDLDMLYEIACNKILIRDGRVPEGAVASILENLEGLVLGSAAPAGEAIRAGLSCGILKEDQARRIGFRHRSFFEFFLSRGLSRQMTTYDASRLARLNLLGAYNVCRFLVPRLLRTHRVVAPVDRRGDRHWVTVDEFAGFCETSGWRRGLGHGLHPYDADSAPEFATDNALRIEWSGFFDGVAKGDRPAASISWFDAVQYCRWTGSKMFGGLQSFADASDKGPPLISWGGTWFDERRAFIAGFKPRADDSGPRIVGLNPDYRSASIGLAVSLAA